MVKFRFGLKPFDLLIYSDAYEALSQFFHYYEKDGIDDSLELGVEIGGKEYFEGDILMNHLVGDLWIVRFENGCFKAGLIPSSGIIKHPDNAKYPYHTELLCDLPNTFEIIGTIWDNPELLEKK